MRIGAKSVSEKLEQELIQSKKVKVLIKYREAEAERRLYKHQLALMKEHFSLWFGITCASKLFKAKQIQRKSEIFKIWWKIVLIERDFKHPLASLLFKEGIKRSINRKATFVYKDG